MRFIRLGSVTAKPQHARQRPCKARKAATAAQAAFRGDSLSGDQAAARMISTALASGIASGVIPWVEMKRISFLVSVSG